MKALILMDHTRSRPLSDDINLLKSTATPYLEMIKFESEYIKINIHISSN